MDYNTIVDFVVRVGFPVAVLIWLGWFLVKYVWPFTTNLITSGNLSRERERREQLELVTKLQTDRDAERKVLTNQIQKAEVDRLNERESFNQLLGSLNTTMATNTREFSGVVSALQNLTGVISELQKSEDRRARELQDGLESIRRSTGRGG